MAWIVTSNQLGENSEVASVKVGNLENCGRHKNLKIIGLPKREESYASIVDF